MPQVIIKHVYNEKKKKQKREANKEHDWGNLRSESSRVESMRKQRRSHTRWDCKQDGYVISGVGTLNKKLLANETAGTRHCQRPVECSRSKQSHALRFLGNSQTMRKRIVPPRGVITIQPNTNRGLHSLQPNMSYKINLHNLLKNTRFNCNQNML